MIENFSKCFECGEYAEDCICAPLGYASIDIPIPVTDGKARWYHTARECDGFFAKGPFDTEKEAMDSLELYCGEGAEQCAVTGSYISDIGGTHNITRCDKVETAEVLEYLVNAYGSRECGIADEDELGLLTRFGW